MLCEICALWGIVIKTYVFLEVFPMEIFNKRFHMLYGKIYKDFIPKLFFSYLEKNSTSGARMFSETVTTFVVC